MRPEARAVAGAFFLGLISLLSQVILIREMMATFLGNELVAGLLLAGWLLWVGLGSFLAGRLSRSFRLIGSGTLALLQAVSAALVPATLVMSRYMVTLTGLTPGETMSPHQVILAAALLPSALCLVLGMQFSVIVGLIFRAGDAPGRESGAVYLVETAGSALGGMMFAFVIAGRVPDMLLALLITAAGLGMGLFTILPDGGRRPGIPIMSASTLFVIAAAASVFVSAPLDMMTREVRWAGFDLAESRDTMYGNLAVTRLGAQSNFFENGLFSFSVPDPITSEESAQLPMAVKGGVRDVLLFGGGVAGILGEVLKYPVASVDYVELDSGLIEFARPYLDPQTAASLDDRRVTTHFGDARSFIRKSRRRYDLILMFLPEPQNALINRMYTVEFFRHVRTALREDGLFSFGLGSSPNYMSEDFLLRNGSIYQTLKSVFPSVTATPLERNIFFACASPSCINLDPAGMKKNLEAAVGGNVYFTAEVARTHLPEDRVAEINAMLAGVPQGLANRDARPVAYLLNLDIWLSRLLGPGRFSMVPGRRPGVTAWIILAAAAAAAAFIPAMFMPRASSARWASAFTMTSTGFSVLSLEIVLLYAFQLSHGYLYREIGAILALVMFGMSAGSFAGRKFARRSAYRRLTLAAEGAFIVLAAAMTAAFMTGEPVMTGMPEAAGRAVYYLLAFLLGGMGGLEFPLLVAIVRRSKTGEEAEAGLIYGLDLIGSCLGAAVVSALVIPMSGLAGAAFLVLLIKAASALLFLSRPAVSED